MTVELPKLTVWYNTKCPVCDSGIERQNNKLIRAVKADAIEFRDINLEPDALSHSGAGLEDVRRRLHGLDAKGEIFIGADCAIEIWRRTPGDAWLGKVFGVPVLRQLARFSYNRLADFLYAWNRYKKHW